MRIVQEEPLPCRPQLRGILSNAVTLTFEYSGFSGLVVHTLVSGTQVRGFEPSQSPWIFGRKILSMPSFGGEVKPSVSCRSFAACKKPLHFWWKSHCRLNLISHFSPIIPPFTDRGHSCHLTWSTSGDERGN
jgi:hypothetical protein